MAKKQKQFKMMEAFDLRLEETAFVICNRDKNDA